MMIRGLRLGLALITLTLRRLESSVWGGLSIFMYRNIFNMIACHESDTTSINISAVCVVQIWFDQGKIRQYVAMPSCSFCLPQTQVTAHFYPMELLPSHRKRTRRIYPNQTLSGPPAPTASAVRLCWRASSHCPVIRNQSGWLDRSGIKVWWIFSPLWSLRFSLAEIQVHTGCIYPVCSPYFSHQFGNSISRPPEDFVVLLSSHNLQ
jgi:hypothetical protein